MIARLRRAWRRPKVGTERRMAKIERRQEELLELVKAIRRDLGGYGVAGSLRHIELGLDAALRGVYLRDAELEPPFSLTARRFRSSSQNDEDGLNLALFAEIGTTSRRFVEIGCGWNGGNSGFLAGELGWSGLMVDGAEERAEAMRRRFDPERVTARAAFVTAESVNEMIADAALGGEIDLLSIDIDGNDLWVWNAIDVVSPRVVICEYNSILGPERAVTIPYDPTFTRRSAGKFYYGASLGALVHLGRSKGYRLVVVEPRGTNAYFLRDDVGTHLPAVDQRAVFRVLDKHERELREGRDVYEDFRRQGLKLVDVADQIRVPSPGAGS